VQTKENNIHIHLTRDGLDFLRVDSFWLIAVVELCGVAGIILGVFILLPEDNFLECSIYTD